MTVDASSFIYQEIKKAKKKLDQAMARGDYEIAAKQALRISELFKELSRVRKWGKKEALEMAQEYRRLYEQLSQGTPPPRRSPRRGHQPRREGQPAGSPSSRGDAGELDVEFDAEAEKLIAKADVTWSDIAGLEEAKRALMEAIYYSLARPSDPGVKLEPPRRFLLYGPPGTGKTMLAMAASNMLKATFINVSVDRVLSRYVGDSPRMISAIFRLAYRRAPSIVFFDEVETLVARRGSGKEAATGLVQTFLTELDGFKTKKLDKPVIVMAATNKPWMLDEAILSRFEKRIYIPLPDREARREIFRLNIEGKGLRLEGITLDELADMTEDYSGRDIANACREATMMMLRRANPDIYKRLEAVGSLEELQRHRYRVEPIRREEILEALKRVKPPISREELKRYEEWAKG